MAKKKNQIKKNKALKPKEEKKKEEVKEVDEKAIFDDILGNSNIDPFNVPRNVSAFDEGRIRNAKDVAYVEAILKAKKKDPWEAIQLILDAWASKKPTEFNGFIKHVDDTRSDLIDKKFGVTRDGGDMERRLTVMMPEHVHHMIRALFTPEELHMDKEFFHEFAKRFPMFKIPEKL